MTETTTSTEQSRASSPPNGAPEETRERQVSTIGFPYVDLANAEQIARGVSDYGGECQITDLASHLNAKVSGAFRSRISSAQHFGLVLAGSGAITITPLGRAILDPKQRASARAEAFLKVELYQKVFDEHAGNTLPGDQGLERFMVARGVAVKQAPRARQTFQRSARDAGYFRNGTDRLTRPPQSELHRDPGSAPPDDEKQGDEGKVKSMADHPVLNALWATLPEKRPFTAEERRRFFTTLAFNIDYVYGPAPDGDFDPSAMATLWQLKATPPAADSAPKQQERSDEPNDSWAAPAGGSDEPPF